MHKRSSFRVINSQMIYLKLRGLIMCLSQIMKIQKKKKSMRGNCGEIKKKKDLKNKTSHKFK